MSKAKSSACSNSHRAATIFIYLFLIAALGTYFLPLQSVTIPAFGKKSWSVQDIVKSFPKGVSKKQAADKTEKHFDVHFDFMDFVKEVTPKERATNAPSRVSQEFIFGALIPVALILTYFFVILSFLFSLFQKTSVLIASSFLSVICSAYVLIGTYYLSAAAQRAFSASLAKVEASAFGIIAKNFVQEISIQPETGLFALVGLTALVLVAATYRKSCS